MHDQKALSISLMNWVQISGSIALSMVFSFDAVSNLGFQFAWLLVGFRSSIRVACYLPKRAIPRFE